MTSEQEVLQLVTDARLTPDALRVVLYVRGLGPAEAEHDVKGEDLAILLQGQEKPIRAAIRRAEHCGYLRWRFGGRAGHKLAYLPPTEIDASQGGICQTHQAAIPPLEASIPPIASSGGVNSDAVGGGYMGGEASPAPPAAPEGARAIVEKPRPAPNGGRVHPPSPAELEPLKAHLGEFAYAVDVFAASADHGGTWPTAVLGRYGPNGTRRDFWRGVPPEREPATIADALLNFASDFAGEPYRAPLFESILTRARDGAPPKKPPPIIPGTEHAAVRSNGHRAEQPGGARAYHRNGTTGLAPLSETGRAYLRQLAESKAGPGAAPEEVERIYAEKLAEAEHHAATRVSA